MLSQLSLSYNSRKLYESARSYSLGVLANHPLRDIYPGFPMPTVLGCTPTGSPYCLSFARTHFHAMNHSRVCTVSIYPSVPQTGLDFCPMRLSSGWNFVQGSLHASFAGNVPFPTSPEYCHRRSRSKQVLDIGTHQDDTSQVGFRVAQGGFPAEPYGRIR